MKDSGVKDMQGGRINKNLLENNFLYWMCYVNLKELSKPSIERKNSKIRLGYFRCVCFISIFIMTFMKSAYEYFI